MVTFQQRIDEENAALDRFVRRGFPHPSIRVKVDLDHNGHPAITPEDPAVYGALRTLEAKRRAGEFQGMISRHAIAQIFAAVVAELIR